MSIDVFFPPGPQKSLLLGNAPQFHHNPFQFLIESARTYGEIVHFRFGPTHAYLLSNPGYAHDVLVERSDKFAETPNLLRALNSAFGHDLTPPSDKFQKRPNNTTYFQPRWLGTFADHSATLAADHAAFWADGQPREMVAELKRLTLNVISHMLFDTATTDVTGRIAEDIFFSRQLQDRRFQSPLTLPEWIPTPTNRKQQKSGSQVNSLIEQMIADHRAQPGRFEGLLAMLLEAADARGGRIDHVTHARDEAISLFHAGHETTAHTLAWAFYLLATNAEAESLLHTELDTVLGGRLPTADDLANLPYTEMVIRETLRLYPPAWLVSRQAKSEVKVANYYLPSGSSVFVSPYIIHHNRRYFTTPDAFIPERFAEGYDRRMPRSAYMPFGAGQRASVEQALALHEATLLLASLASRFTFTLEPGQTVTPEARLTMRPLGGLKMAVQTR